MKNENRRVVLMFVALLALPGMGRTDIAQNGHPSSKASSPSSEAGRRLPATFRDGPGPMCIPGIGCGPAIKAGGPVSRPTPQLPIVVPHGIGPTCFPGLGGCPSV